MNYSSPVPNRLEHVVRPAAAQSTRPKFAFRFQLLRVSDLSPVNAQRVAALDGKTVPCGKIVIGCEYAPAVIVALAPDYRPFAAQILELEKKLHVRLVPVSQQATDGLILRTVNNPGMIDDATLAQLAPVAALIVDAELARTKVSDAGLATLARFENLRKLDLSHTVVTAAGLPALGALAHLEWLNLVGTAVGEDAAATLAGLNQLWCLGLDNAELARLAAQIGSDVAFFFHTPLAWATGRGEVVTTQPLGRPLDLLIIAPGVGLGTADVYRRVTPPATPRSGDEIRAAAAAGDVAEIGRALHNRLQAPAEQLCPTVAAWQRRLAGLGAAGALMSGSGSSLFALCRDRHEAVRLAREVRKEARDTDGRLFLVRSCV